MSDVQAAGAAVVTEASNHVVSGLAVSVCLTPAAPSPLPIPYPTIGSSAEGIVDAPIRTKIDGVPVCTVGSCISVCHGNEAGTLKEVVSLNTGGPTFPILGAPNVFVEMGMAATTGSPGQMNKAVTVGAPANASNADGALGVGGATAGDTIAPLTPFAAAHAPQNRPRRPHFDHAVGATERGHGHLTELRRLAASPGRSAEQVAARKAVAEEFYNVHGQKFDYKSGRVRRLTEDEHVSELACIDYDKPVDVGPPPPCPRPLGQWQTPAGLRGNYFAPPGSPPTDLGIGADGKEWTAPGQPVVPKVEKTYGIDRGTRYLRSTAARATDTWSVPGRPQPAQGGGTQFYVPTSSEFDTTTVTRSDP